MNENYKNAVQLLSNISIYNDDDIRFQLWFWPASKQHKININKPLYNIEDTLPINNEDALAIKAKLKWTFEDGHQSYTLRYIKA